MNYKTVLEELRNKVLHEQELFKQDIKNGEDFHPEFINGSKIMSEIFLEMIDGVEKKYLEYENESNESIIVNINF